MGQIVVSQFVTVDGVMEDPGGSEGMERGGWALQFDRGEDGDKFKLDEVMGSDALLLGRVTYEGFAAAWPSREGDFADKFNTMPKYVVSSTLSDPEWSNSTVVGVPDVAGLKDQHDTVLVNGSRRLVDGNGEILLEGGPPTTETFVTIPANETVTTLVQVNNYCGPTPVAPVSIAFVVDDTRVTATTDPEVETDVPPCNGPGEPGTIEMRSWGS